MGADISLRPVLTDEVHKAIIERAVENHRSIKTSADVMQVGAGAIYTALEETGAYFRDPYNRFGLLPMLGMSWGADVGPLLSEDGLLPIEAARHHLGEIESRPLTPANIEAAITGPPPHPVIAWMERSGFIEPYPDPAIDDIDWPAIHARLTNKRKQLIALLRRSIELDERLLCDI
jgi:hypothetical protein